MDNIVKTLNKEELQKVKIIKASKGEILFNEGDICESVGIVLDGEVHILSYLENGQEIIYNIVGQSKIFGNNLIFSTDPIYRGDVVSSVDSDIMLIDKKNLVYLMQNNQDFLLAFLNQQSDFGKELNLKMRILTFKNAKDRVLYFLQVNHGIIAYKSITKLAQILYLTREVLSRTLHDLEHAKVIKLEDKKIVKL